jgi:hypothetical protein
MNYFVRLREDSSFTRVFPECLVPVKQVPLPNSWSPRGVAATTFVTCALCGDARDPEPCCWLDWSRLTAVQRANLADEVCRLRGGTTAEFLTYMDRGGDMPIRVSQTVAAPFLL